MKYDISFVGLGKLGLPLATNFAKSGKTVLAIDKNPVLLETLKRHDSPWSEPGLADNINEAITNITYTDDYSRVAESEYSIILVNTPSKSKDGSFSNEYIISSLTSICEQLKASGKESHKFILSSTVMPGSIKNEFVPLINNILGWELDNQYTFSYVPDFVAIGSVIQNFHQPDFVLVGSSNEETAREVHKLYSCMLTSIVPTSFLTLAEAELAKVSLNAYITTKISFANYLGVLAEKLDPEINVDNITTAIGQDKRIGGKYFKAGAPYGGTCFPRDTWAFMQVSSLAGLVANQMTANESINNLTLQSIKEKILNTGSKNIGLIGLGFKPGTPVTTEGVAEKLIKEFDDSYTFYAYDAINDAYNNLSQSKVSFTPVEDIDELNNEVDTVVLCNGDPIYKVNDIDTTINIIDPWRTV